MKRAICLQNFRFRIIHVTDSNADNIRARFRQRYGHTSAQPFADACDASDLAAQVK
jgi:hypothetical protein